MKKYIIWKARLKIWMWVKSSLTFDLVNRAMCYVGYFVFSATEWLHLFFTVNCNCFLIWQSFTRAVWCSNSNLIFFFLQKKDDGLACTPIFWISDDSSRDIIAQYPSSNIEHAQLVLRFCGAKNSVHPYHLQLNISLKNCSKTREYLVVPQLHCGLCQMFIS